MASAPRLLFCRHGEAAHNPFLVAAKAAADDAEKAKQFRLGRCEHSSQTRAEK